MTDRFIYFIKPIDADGPVKIGISARPEGRIFEMLEWSPVDLEVAHKMPGDYKLERAIQEALANDHIRREWFRASPRIVKMLSDLRAGVPIGKAVDLTRKEAALYNRAGRRSVSTRKTSIDHRSGLTEGQRDCLAFVKGFIAAEHRTPTYQEISDGMGLHSKSGVFRYITALVERGYLARTPGRQGTLSVVEDPYLMRAA